MSSNIRINKVCQYCQSEFVAKTTVTKFCSDNCAKRAYKLRLRNQKIEPAEETTKTFSKSSSSDLNEKPFLNITEAGKLLGSSRWTIHRLIKSGHLKAAKVGTKTIIPRKSIDNLFQS
jgi:excisionase family DNA binding protein